MKIDVIVRVLDGDGELLAWSAVPCETRMDQRLWPLVPYFEAVGEKDGDAVSLVCHWPELHVVSRVPFAGRWSKDVSQRIAFTGPLMLFATMDGPLPGVTVRRHVAVGPDAGAILNRGVVR